MHRPQFSLVTTPPVEGRVGDVARTWFPSFVPALNPLPQAIILFAWLAIFLGADTVLAAPAIVQHPVSQERVPLQGTAKFSVAAQGRGTLRYRWRQNGVLLDGESSRRPELSIPIVSQSSGGTYDVVVTDDTGSTVSRPARLTLDLPLGSLTDDFDGTRTVVAAPNGVVSFDNFRASREGGEPAHDGKNGRHSVWMTWRSPHASGIAQFNTRGSTFDTVLAVYKGNDLRSLERVAANDDGGGYSTSALQFRVEPHVTYHIAVDGRGNTAGAVVLAWACTESGQAVPSITVQPQDQAAAEGQSVRLFVGYNLLEVDVQWFFNGSPIGVGRPVAEPRGNELILPNVTTAQAGKYFARVSARSSSGNRSAVSRSAAVQINSVNGRADRTVVTLDKYADLSDQEVERLAGAAVTLQSLDRPPVAAAGAPARGYSGTQIFSTIGAGAEPGEPVHCGVPGGVSEWYAIQAEATGTLAIDTLGSNFDTVLAVYVDPANGGSMEDLVPLTCNNDVGAGASSSRVEFACTAGTVYFIAVDGVQGATGLAVLNYFLNRPPRISAIGDQTVAEGRATGAIDFSISDPETGASSLKLSVASSNPGLVPVGNVVIGGSFGTRTVVVNPVPGQAGTAIITISVEDQHGSSSATSFAVTVISTNRPPTIDPIPDRVVSEDSGPHTIPLTGIGPGAGDEGQSVAITAESSDPGLLPHPTVLHSGSDRAAMLTFAPAKDRSGTAVVTVTVRDGNAQNGTTRVSFPVTVTAVNDPPTLDPIPDLFVRSVSTQQSVVLSGIGSGAPNEVQPLVVSASSSDPSVASVALVNYSSPATSGSLLLAVPPGSAGTTVIRVAVSDGSAENGTVIRTFTLRADPVLQAPVVSEIPAQSIVEDGEAGPILVALQDDRTPASLLRIELVSSNPALLPHDGIVLSGTDATRFLVLRPVRDGTGEVDIALRVTDGDGLVTTRVFPLKVLPVNDLPSIGAIPAQVLAMGTASPAVPFVVGDVETSAGSLVVSATSSNSELLPPESLVLGGEGAHRTIELRPPANRSGLADVTVRVTDEHGGFSASTFSVRVTGPGDSPLIGVIPDQTIREDSVSLPIAIPLTAAGWPVDRVVLSAQCSDPTLVPDGNIVFGGTGANRICLITPAPDRIGVATVIIRGEEPGGLTGTSQFLLTVTSVNDPPVASARTVTVARNTPQKITLTGVDPEGQPLFYEIVSPPSKGTLQGTPPQLTYTPRADFTGSDVFSFRVSDGTATSDLTPVRLNVVEASPVQVSTALVGGGTEVRVAVRGPAGYSYSIESSSDFVTWTLRTTIVNVSGTFSYYDQVTPGELRFYRVRLLD